MLERGAVVGGRWRLEELLGEGALSQVWRVRHTELGNQAALKVLVIKRPRLAERLILEGRIQAQLRHPHIVMVTDVVRHEGYVSLLMDLVEGMPLDHHMATRGALPVEESLATMAAVCSAVAAAHDAGVLHRDLKPANILLARTADGYIPKVADFGIAKVLESSGEPGQTRVGAVMGTPGYLAPEQAIDASTADARCDVFALGVIAFELLTGRRAFDTEDVDLHALPTPARADALSPDVPASVADAVAKAMAMAPDDRQSSVRAFATALLAEHPALLARFEAGSPSTPLTLSGELPAIHTHSAATLPPDDAAPPPRRRPLLLLWGGALFFGTVAFAALWVGQQPNAPTRGDPVEPPAVVSAPDPVPEPAPEPLPPSEPEPVEPVVEDSPAPAPTPNTKTAAVATPSAPSRPAVEQAADEPPEVEVPTEPTEPATIDADAPPTDTDAEVPLEAEPASAETREDAVADALIITEPEPPPPPKAPPIADLTGTWRGQASGRPMRIRITSQQQGALRGEAVFLLGATERQYDLTGTIDAEGQLRLADAGGGLVLQGKVDGAEATGTYRITGSKDALPFSIRWDSR